MLGDSTTFRALPSVALTLPWSLIITIPIIYIQSIMNADFFKSIIPATIIICISGLVNSYVIYFLISTFDSRISRPTPPPLPKV